MGCARVWAWSEDIEKKEINGTEAREQRVYLAHARHYGATTVRIIIVCMTLYAVVCSPHSPIEDLRECDGTLRNVNEHVVLLLAEGEGDDAKLLLHCARGKCLDRGARFGAAVQCKVDARITRRQHGGAARVAGPERRGEGEWRG